MKSQRKNLDLCENHLFKLKQREKDEEGVISGQKLTQNHHSMKKLEEKT